MQENFIGVVGIIFGVIILVGIVSSFIKMYRKAVQGEALVRTGMGGTKVSFSGNVCSARFTQAGDHGYHT